MLEMHALLDGRERRVPDPAYLQNFFKLYKEYAVRFGEKNVDFNSFAAGFQIANSATLKEKAYCLDRYNKRAEGFYDKWDFFKQ